MPQLSTESVWAQLSSDLRQFIRRKVSDEHVADDVLQETFVRIHRSLASLQNEERLAAWVHQIARNAINDHYRRTPGDRALPAENLEQAAGNPLEPLQSHASEWMQELIELLPEDYRAALKLAEIEGLTQQHVAERLGLSLSGAKSRVQRGRALLRELLNQCCTFQFDHAGRLMDCDPLPDRRVCKDCG
jgi:RNA polymerase sigma-70 factor (ECF subfamily)